MSAMFLLKDFTGRVTAGLPVTKPQGSPPPPPPLTTIGGRPMTPARHATAEEMLAGIRAEMAAKDYFVQTVIRPAYHLIPSEPQQLRALEWMDEANEMQRAVEALDKAIKSLAPPVKPKHVHRHD